MASDATCLSLPPSPHLGKPDMERGARHDAILVLNHHDVQGATAAAGRNAATVASENRPKGGGQGGRRSAGGGRGRRGGWWV